MKIRQPLVRRAPRPPFGLQKGLPTGITAHFDSLAAQQLALDNMGAAGGTWWYKYSPTREGLTSPAGMKFLPMFTTLGELTPSAIAAAAAEAGPNGWIMYLNEPENEGISVADGIAGWNTLINDINIRGYNNRLLSPVPLNTDAADGTSQWFHDWMAGIAALPLVRFPDAIAIHRYNSVANTVIARAASYHIAYPGFQIWITEFGEGAFVNNATTQAFMLAIYRALIGATFVDRLAYFTLGYFPAETWRNHANTDGSLTANGTYWKGLSFGSL